MYKFACLKQVSCILLLLILFQSVLFKVGIFIYWKANQTYIAKAFCENKNKPEMHCNGKCLLKKQIKKVEETSNNKPFEIPKYKDLKLDPFTIIEHSTKMSSHKLFAEKTKHSLCPANFYTKKFSYQKFNPPNVYFII